MKFIRRAAVTFGRRGLAADTGLPGSAGSRFGMFPGKKGRLSGSVVIRWIATRSPFHIGRFNQHSMITSVLASGVLMADVRWKVALPEKGHPSLSSYRHLLRTEFSFCAVLPTPSANV